MNLLWHRLTYGSSQTQTHLSNQRHPKRGRRSDVVSGPFCSHCTAGVGLLVCQRVGVSPVVMGIVT